MRRAPVSRPGLPGRLCRLLRWLAVVAGVTAAALAAAWRAFPFPVEKLGQFPSATYLLDREGRPMRVVLGPGDMISDPVPLAAAGDWAGKALVAVEDKRFFSHPGLDPLAIARAAAQNVAHGRVISGASTLSSQVIRLTEPRPRTLPAKAVEGWRALQMDARLTKAEILAQYLNRAPMGGALEGIAAASRAYFGKDPADLDLAEAALLMGLPQSPSRLRPTRHPDRALRRRHAVLERMAALGYITADEFRAADEAPVTVQARALPFAAPHFCELARTRLASAPRPAGTPHRVRTTIDPGLQALAEDALGRQAAERRERGVAGGAVVILEVASGAVRALVGSPDFHDAAAAGQVNGATALRSPGSALKPFAYALALDRGLYTPALRLDDAPIQFRDYCPRNYDGEFTGPVSVRQALSRSLNIPALATAQAVGLADFLALLRETGLTSLDRPAGAYGLSLVLGAAEVSLLELTAAYAALAYGGDWRPPRIWEEAAVPVPRRVISPEAAYLVADILEGGERLMDLCGHVAEARAPRVAWKTGTSAGHRDAWTIAYNPEYAVGVWLGNPAGHGSPILVGAQVAAPIAYAVFRGLYPDGDGPWFACPPGIRRTAVCAETGRPAGPGCPATVEDLHIAGVSDPTSCARHAGIHRPRPPPRITSPVDGARYLLADGLPAGIQAIVLTADAGGTTDVHWFVNGVHLGAARADAPRPWALAPGPHKITCADPDGRAHSVHIRVERCPPGPGRNPA